MVVAWNDGAFSWEVEAHVSSWGVEAHPFSRGFFRVEEAQPFLRAIHEAGGGL